MASEHFFFVTIASKITMDAFAISDKRRLSCSTNLTKDNVCTPCSSALSSFVQQSVSGILLEESSDSEDEHHKDDGKNNCNL
jgi:hypothetical protein